MVEVARSGDLFADATHTDAGEPIQSADALVDIFEMETRLNDAHTAIELAGNRVCAFADRLAPHKVGAVVHVLLVPTPASRRSVSVDVAATVWRQDVCARLALAMAPRVRVNGVVADSALCRETHSPVPANERRVPAVAAVVQFLLASPSVTGQTVDVFDGA